MIWWCNVVWCNQPCSEKMLQQVCYGKYNVTWIARQVMAWVWALLVCFQEIRKSWRKILRKKKQRIWSSTSPQLARESVEVEDRGLVLLDDTTGYAGFDTWWWWSGWWWWWWLEGCLLQSGQCRLWYLNQALQSSDNSLSACIRDDTTIQVKQTQNLYHWDLMRSPLKH